MSPEDKIHKPRRRDIRHLLFSALKHPYDGRRVINDRHYMVADSITEPGRPVSLVLTLDSGIHASGWWRNSDYDRCLHLSLAHPTSTMIRTHRVETPTDKEVAAWGREILGPQLQKCWIEPAASLFDPHRKPNTPHVRLFLDRQNRPIVPQGEVYHLKPWPDGSSPEKIFRRTGKS
jgi:hypothetical protein